VRDTTLAMTERLRAAEQLENRGMGKPKETVETVNGKSEVDEALDRMPTRPGLARLFQGRGGGGWHPPRARSRAESHRGRRRPQPR
jgi:hypothetical protein